MSDERPALFTEEILFKKQGEGLNTSLGVLELYEDSLLIRQKWKGQFDAPDTGEVTSGDEGPLSSGELIAFSNIRGIDGIVKGILFKVAEIRIHTELDVTWEIRGSPKIYQATLGAFQAWKNRVS